MTRPAARRALVAVVSALALAMTLAACGGPNSSDTSNDVYQPPLPVISPSYAPAPRSTG